MLHSKRARGAGTSAGVFVRSTLVGAAVVAAAVSFAACDARDEPSKVAAVKDQTSSTTTDERRESTTGQATASSTTAGGGANATSSSEPQGYRGTAAPTVKPAPATPTTTESTVKASDSDVADAERLVELAKLDLVRRKGYDKHEIRLLSIESVTWPNAALGCPNHEKEYDEEDVPGYRIELQWKDLEYPYHGRNGSDPFLCQKLD